MQRPTINLNLVRKNTLVQNETFVTDSPTLSNKRRKNKVYSNRKTNEEIIQESFVDLMSYVDQVDDQVQEIIRTYEAEFLEAYQIHIKKVRGEMDQLKKKALNSNNSEEAFLKKIDSMEKQLVLFREQSLKLFDKLKDKDKNIQALNMKIQQLTNDNKYYQSRLKALSKHNKELEVELASLREQKASVLALEEKKSFKRECRSENKMRQVFTSQQRQHQLHPIDQIRPITSQLYQNNKTITLHLNSKEKSQNISQEELNVLRQQIAEKIGDQRQVKSKQFLNIIQEKSQNDPGHNMSSDNRKARSQFLVKAQKRRQSHYGQDSSLLQMKSGELAEKNELSNILKQCIQEVKKDVIRRNNIASLNFFKGNGPMSYIQFKKTDQFTLIGLLLQNDKVLKRFYEILLENTK